MMEKSPQRRTLLKALILWRCILAVQSKTFFQADEFWQSLEPAHFKAFGYGELTWEWEYGLRSYAFPLIFEIGYILVKHFANFCGFFVRLAVILVAIFVQYVVPQYELGWEIVNEMMGFPSAVKEFAEYYGVLYSPKLIMGVLAGIGEYFLVLLVLKIHKLTMDKTEDKKDNKSLTLLRITVFITLSNFFNAYFMTRTFINSFEMILTTIALYYWDWTLGEGVGKWDFNKSLLIAIFTCFQRPNNAIIWITLGLFLIVNIISSRKWDRVSKLLLQIFLSFFVASSLNMGIDRYFYGYWTIPVLKFLKFNFTSPLSKFYGVSPWHFHLLQSVPLLCGYTLPLFLHSIMTHLSDKHFSSILKNPFFQLKIVVLINIVVFSVLPHKEFRFIYALQPIFTLLTAFDAHILLARFSFITKQNEINLGNFSPIALGVPLVSLLLALFLSIIHESGSVEVMHKLHFPKNVDSIGFIMPCHSTPWQSHMHRNDINTLWAISCEPPLHLLDTNNIDEELKEYMDESDYLYENVKKFIYQNFPPVFRKTLRQQDKIFKYEWPEYLVIFEQLNDIFMEEYLKDSPYFLEHRIFNSWSHWDARRKGDILVYHKIPWA